MKEKITKLLDNKITFADFLQEGRQNLQLVAITFNTIDDSMDVKYGSENEEVKIGSCGFEKVKENGQDLTPVLVDLKSDWKKILNEEGYKDDLDDFMSKYKLTKLTINMQNEEVKFFSGNNHLVEGLDIYNQ